MSEPRNIYYTVFDKNYLVQAMALYQSLDQFGADWVIYCLAMDIESVELLQKLDRPHLRIITLESLPQSELKLAREQMSWGQFCWSMQPLVGIYLFKQGLTHATYLEADSFFYSDPKVAFEEIGLRSISLAPHWYSEEASHSERDSGTYCTHFNFFRNDEEGRSCLQFWKENCFQYRRDNNKTHPGQLCLNQWPTKFKNIAIFQNRGVGVAPWNVSQYKVHAGPLIDETPVVFYHFHQLTRYKNGNFEMGNYSLSKEVVEFIYRPYLQAILNIEEEIKKVDASFKARREISNPPQLWESLQGSFRSKSLLPIKSYLRPLKRKLQGRHNVYLKGKLGTSTQS